MSKPSTKEMLKILADRAQKLLDEKSPKDAMRGRLLADIANLVDEIEAGPVTEERWADHELRWQEHVTDLRQAVVEGSARVMLAFEAMAKHEPSKITPEIAEELNWWRSGGREQFLGELPLEVRRRLEAEAAKLPNRE